MATSKKHKSTARESAVRRVASRRGAPQSPKVPASSARNSQSRYPGETPLTGEDRPATSPGRKRAAGRSQGR